MTTKDFINKFNFSNPDWTKLPDNWPNLDFKNLSSPEIGKLSAIKTIWESSRPEKQSQRSRVWTDPEGYKFLVQWSNAVLLRYLVRKFTDTLPILNYRGNYRNLKDNKGMAIEQSNVPLQSFIRPLNRPSEHRRKAQLDDAARSVVRNIEEGYKRPTTQEYLNFLGYSQASLEEVKGDVVELAQDGFLKTRRGSALSDLGVSLSDFHDRLKEIKGFYRNLEEVYSPLNNFAGQNLTVEQFLELINKTDFLLRKLVESLERKQNQQGKFYQVEQARIRGAIKGY